MLNPSPDVVALNSDVFGRSDFDVHGYLVDCAESPDLQLTEHQIQANYFKRVELQAQFDERYKLIFAIPNGGKRHKKTAAEMKREGAKSGVSDIFISVPVGDYPGAYLETKRGKYKPKTARAKKGGLSDEQIDFIERVTERGYYVRVCYSTDELELATLDYLGD